MSDTRPDTQPVQLGEGELVGAYRIERPIGSGGMAEVFYAIHEGLQRPAAIKVLRASLATDEVHLQRFMQEARAAASLIHPNIVQVYDVGQDGEHRYIAQEYIPGSNLRQYMSHNGSPAESRAPEGNAPQPIETGEIEAHASDAQLSETEASKAQGKGGGGSSSNNTVANVASTQDRQLGIAETLSILLQILAALNKSAKSGIVHRDIKPENIMLTTDGEVKVADFGLARVLLGDDPQLTRAGTTLGTPMYMSPEQIQEGQVDIRSDLYSLGVTLFHMLAGQPPYLGETPLALAMKHVQAPIPDVRQLRDDLPDSLVDLIVRLLAKEPADRFENPGEVLDFLSKNRSGDLAAIWPEETVPLPRARVSQVAGPMQATMLLQSKLRKARQESRAKWGRRAAGLAVVLLALVAGAAITFRPFQLFEGSPTDIYKDIVRQTSAHKQYQFALLSNDLDRFAKWEAVEYYFPKSESRTARMYAGMASIQLARALQNKLDYDGAREVLRKTTTDPEMNDLYRALAFLQMAMVDEDDGDIDNMEKNLQEAIQIATKDGFSGGDRQQLLDQLNWTSSRIRNSWPAQPDPS